MPWQQGRGADDPPSGRTAADIGSTCSNTAARAAIIATQRGPLTITSRPPGTSPAPPPRRHPRKPPEDEREIKADDEIKRLAPQEQAVQVRLAGQGQEESGGTLLLQRSAAGRSEAVQPQSHLPLHLSNRCASPLVQSSPAPARSCARSGCT